ncbi:calmodulin-binding protein 60 A [Coffea arabica]|uniref:Calmodulin-binding protein 60 A n=1 Tax=Coffea arabica TaxID=13443 RepID=A0A6P6XFB4_COFAR|nr:calmodulin-binding protein 60 A-like [Coffea arabica]
MSDIPEVQEYTNLCFAGSQQQTNALLDDPNLASAIKKMVEVQLAVMLFPTVKRIVESFLGSLEPMMENLVRKTVKQEIELAQERFFTREKWKPHDDPHTSQVRCLELQFLDRISSPVYTGKQIKGERGDSIKLALVDSDGNLVNSGPEASARVEILVVQEGACHGDNSYNCGDSEGVISEKKGRKPLLFRNYFKMKEGIVDLEDVKFKNKAKWTKSCEVNLVARVVENLNGTKVKDAKTESFRVMDCRSTLYKKHDPPMLSDEVWRLQKIGKEGRLHKRLQEAKIYSVKEFLISLNLDPRSLQQRLNVGAEKFKVIVDHARRCEIGGKLYVYHTSGHERKFPVVFDVVGHLRGLVREQLFVPVHDLAEDEKVEAHKMVVSAFEHWEDVQSIDNEASLADIPSQFSGGVNTSISSRIESPTGSNFGICNTISGNCRALSRTSSRHMSPVYSIGGTSFFDGVAGLFQMDNMDSACADSDNEYQQFLIWNHDDSLEFGNPNVESRADQSTADIGCHRIDAQVLSPSRAQLRWRMAIVSVRKRNMAPEDTHSQKKQRHS